MSNEEDIAKATLGLRMLAGEFVAAIVVVRAVKRHRNRKMDKQEQQDLGSDD